MTVFTDVRRAVLVSIVCVALILGGQALGASTASFDATRSTEAVAQRAGFAYLTGIRTAVAAMMWNRLEVLLHGYYESDGGVGEAAYAVPTIALVNLLDPSMEDPYTVGAWIVARQGHVRDALSVAETGVEANPDSAHLEANYAQILYLFAHDLDGAVARADRALEGRWPRDTDELADLQLIRVVYEKAGRKADAARVATRIREVQKRPVPNDEPKRGWR